MTIGTNNILNAAIETTKGKSSKKDYSSIDYSAISNQFANIFSSQYLTSFDNQFSYNSQGGKADFMANTAHKVTENKYYSATDSNSYQQRTQEKISQQRTEQKADTSYQKKEEPAKIEKTDNSKAENTKTEKAEVKEETSQTKTDETQQKKAEENTSVQTQETSQNEALKGSVKKEAKLEKGKIELTKEDSVKLEKTTEDSEKANLVKVAIKDKEIKEVTDLKEKTQLDISEITETIEVTEVGKVKKDALKITHEKKEPNIEQKTEAKKTHLKEEAKTVETTEVKKESLEKLVANIVDETSKDAEVDVLEKLLNKNSKKSDFQKKNEASSSHAVELKNPTAFANQNLAQNFGQNTNKEQHLSDNLLKMGLSFDTSGMKNNVQNDFSLHNLIQKTQSQNVMQKNITEQVMNQIKGNIDAEKSQLTMVLKPENLGKVTLNIMNERGTLSAEIKTQSQEAADALNKSINDLKETLKQQGVICSNLVVKADESQKSENQTNLTQQENQKDSEQHENFGNSKEGSFQNSTHKEAHTAKTELNQNIQEENPAEETAENKGLVDYRV